MKFKIAVVQLNPEYNASKNLKKVKKYVQKLSKEADIIVFPEYFVDSKPLIKGYYGATEL